MDLQLGDPVDQGLLLAVRALERRVDANGVLQPQLNGREHMRKLLALATLVGTALVVGVSPASTAKIDDLHGGPVCADILNDSGIFDYDPAAGTVTFALLTAAP